MSTIIASLHSRNESRLGQLHASSADGEDVVQHRQAKRRKTGNESTDELAQAAAASVLFRPLSTTVKKHTRPPISKLYSSLQLSPEQFLDLQAAAKDYMLDDRFPERRDTVGNRGKGDPEQVKLRLWKCVEGFLESGNGERFFEDGIMIWPRDGEKIKTAVLPLLRRAITNERQRQYALETRNKGASTDEPESLQSGKDVTPQEESIHPCPWTPMDYKTGTLFHELTSQDLSSYVNWKVHYNCPRVLKFYQETGIESEHFDEVLAIIDYHLRIYHNSSDETIVQCSRPCENTLVSSIVDSHGELWIDGHWRNEEIDVNPCDKSINVRIVLRELFQHLKVLTGHLSEEEAIAVPELPVVQERTETMRDPRPCTSPLILRITIMKDDTILAKREISAADTPYKHTLLQKASDSQVGFCLQNAKVQIHLPAGMTLVEDDKVWSSALSIARQTPWLDHQVHVVIQAGVPIQ